MQWSPQQDTALVEVARWLESFDQPIFRLFGYAGTGKTTLARHFSEGVSSVAFGAFTGKAALRLQEKGCENASTIHSMIYTSSAAAEARLRALEYELSELLAELKNEGNFESEDEFQKYILQHHGVVELQRKITEADKDAAQPRFKLNRDAEIAACDLIVVDECSMVDDQMGSDLLSFGVPILALGDPAQLPPVGSGGYFTDHEPDFMLTEIHRQAAENPILQLATKARNQEKITPGEYGDKCRVIYQEDLTRGMALSGDQMIVGKNKTRQVNNDKMRALKGYGGELPCEGERLICLQNDNKKGLLNGGMWEAETIERISEDRCLLRVSSLDLNAGKAIEVEAHTQHFEGRSEDLHWSKRRDVAEFTYAHAITCHKSQGSEWDHVIVIDESGVFRENAHRWLYTAITRAAEELTIVR